MKDKVYIYYRKFMVLLTSLACIFGCVTTQTPVFAQLSDVSTTAAAITEGSAAGKAWLKDVGQDNSGWSSYADSKKNALKVRSDYGFKLYKTKDSKFSVTDGKEVDAPTSEHDLTDSMKNFKWFKTKNNKAGEIKVKYTNLKIYQCDADGSNGHYVDVDLERTITKIEKYQGKDTCYDSNGNQRDCYVALGKGLTQTMYVGVEEVKTHNAFYKAGTTTPIKLKTNVTLTDVDAWQYVGVEKDEVVGHYVSKKTTLIYKNNDGTATYYDNTGVNVTNQGDKPVGDPEAVCVAFTMDSNKFNYTFGRHRKDDDKKDIEPSGDVQYLGSGQNMTDFPPADPTKGIMENETIVTENHVRNIYGNWTYQVSQAIASDIPENFYFDNFSFEDQIEECMKINSVKVYGVNNNGNDKNITSLFTVTTNGNKVVAKLNNPKDADFYDYHEIKLQVNVSMDVPENATEEQMEALRSKWTEHGHYDETKTTIIEKNKATTIIDSTSRQTNEVKTNLHLSTIPDTPGGGGNKNPGLAISKDVNRYEHQVNDKIKYTVKAWNTNEKADVAGFIIDDTTLPDGVALDFDSIKVEGIDASNYTLEQSGNGWVLKSKGTYALPYGTTITVTYEGTAKTSANGTLVDNTATSIAIGVPKQQDSEQVYINSPKTDVEKEAPDRNYKVGDTVGYKVNITNRNPGTFMRDIVLSDLVETKGLEIKEGSVAILVGGKDVTDQMDVTYKDDSTGFTIKTPYNLKNGTIPCLALNPYNTINNWVDKIVVTYDATITNEAALETNLKNVFEAPATPNTNGDLIRDDETIPSGGGSSEEEVKMKAPALDIEKKSNKQEYQVGETGKYTLTVKQTKEETTALNVVVNDAFVQEEGLTIDQGSLVVKMNGEDITKDCKITANATNFKVETGKNMTDEDELVITYNVNFTKAGEYTNTAIATSDNTNEDQSTNVVEVKEATPKLTIDKKSDKDTYAVGETGTYTLTVNETNKEATAKNVVIKDKFATTEGLSIDQDSLVVKMNGEDITKNCSITTNTADFYITTGKDMTSKDEITVSYLVTFTKTGTYKNTATTQADNTDPDEDDNSVEVKNSDFTITKDADKKSYEVGDYVNYKVTVALKKEGAVSKNVVITDEIPEGLELQEDSIEVTGIDADAYTESVKDNVMTIKIPELKYGQTVVVTYQAKVLSSAAGKELTNKAEVKGEGVNPGSAKVTVKVPKTTKAKTPISGKTSSGSNVPKTGDTNHTLPMVGAFVIAAIGIGVVLRKKFKK